MARHLETLTMVVRFDPVEYRYPCCAWLTGHPPRWSEIRRHFWNPDAGEPACMDFMLVYDPGGMRPPACDTMMPVASALLGLPLFFAGTDWRDGARTRKVAPFVRRVARSQRAVRGFLTPGARAVHARAGRLLAVAGVPLAPEGGTREVGADDGGLGGEVKGGAEKHVGRRGARSVPGGPEAVWLEH